MEDKKLPEFLKNMPKIDPDVLKGIMGNPPKTFTPYYGEDLNPTKKVLDQLEQNFKKKSFRENVLFWITVSSIILAVASLVVSIIALKN